MPCSPPVRFWWWGEDEAPGLASWVARTTQQHEVAADVRVETRLLRHDRVIPSLPAAATDGDTPDLHFLWNGIYHIEHAWDGLLLPLEDMFQPDQVSAISGGSQSRFRGQTYRAGWYLIPVMWVANRELLSRAGVDELPQSWDELTEACERLLAAGISPIVAGDGEGDLSVWWLTHLLTQTLDLGSDVAQLALGERSWREPRYDRAWRELHRFVEAGWIDRAHLPLTLWDAFTRFSDGNGAFTLASGPMFVGCKRRLGDRAEIMIAPQLDAGDLAGRPIVDSQGLGIPAHSASAAAGAALLEALLAAPACESLYDQLGLLPARRDWGGPTSGSDRSLEPVRDQYARGKSAPYVPNLLPLALHFDVCAEVGGAVIAGGLKPVDAGEEADLRCTRWRSTDPARQDLYREWIGDVRRHEQEGAHP